jgi:hypothetical protein
MIRIINLRALSFCEAPQNVRRTCKLWEFWGDALPSSGCLLELLPLLLLLLLEDGCLQHASTSCSRSLHLRQQQLCLHASLLEELKPP